MFTCESDSRKQQYLLRHVHDHAWASGSTDGCLYKNTEHMSKAAAECARHKQQCDIASGSTGPFLLAAGFSCKTLSGLNVHRSEMSAACLTAKKGSTGKTFADLVEYCRTHRPPVLVLENVPEILNEGTGNLSAMRSYFDDMGYSMAHALVQAEQQGGSCVRRRAYFVVLNRTVFGFSGEVASAVLSQIMLILGKIKVDPVQSVSQLVLPSDHELVQAELAEMQNNGSQAAGDSKWPDQHMQHMLDAGVSFSSLKLPDEVRASPWYQAMPQRTKQYLAYKWHAEPHAGVLELSQSMSHSGAPSSSAFKAPEGDAA